MKKLSKRMQAIRNKVGERTQSRDVSTALQLLKECSSVKFNEAVDVAINLGIDPRKSDQGVRGAIVLPNGTGRTVRIAVFAQGEAAEAAKRAGADRVGFDDLVDDVQQGNIDFDVVIATPDAMKIVGKLGQVLGPRGLMPNPKVGTVTTDVGKAVHNAKSGQVQFRADKNGVIHCSIGRVNFEVQALKENLEALVSELKRVKPSAVKGIYLKKMTVSTTMGPGLLVDQSSLAG